MLEKFGEIEGVKVKSVIGFLVKPGNQFVAQQIGNQRPQIFAMNGCAAGFFINKLADITEAALGKKASVVKHDKAVGYRLNLM